MSEYYKTGDITLTKDGFMRIYIREVNQKCGYFFKKEDAQAHFVAHKSDSVALVKNTSEPVITTLDDVMEAIRATYGKEIR